MIPDPMLLGCRIDRYETFPERIPKIKPYCHQADLAQKSHSSKNPFIGIDESIFRINTVLFISQTTSFDSSQQMIIFRLRIMRQRLYTYIPKLNQIRGSLTLLLM